MVLILTKYPGHRSFLMVFILKRPVSPLKHTGPLREFETFKQVNKKDILKSLLRCQSRQAERRRGEPSEERNTGDLIVVASFSKPIREYLLCICRTTLGKKKRNKEKGESSSQIPSPPRLTGSPANNNDDDAAASTSGRGNRVTPSQATNPLTVGQAIVRENYLSCCRQFYTLPELIEFMTARHRGLTAEMVTEAYRGMLQSINAEMYIRLAQYHSTVRQNERNRLETDTAPQSDGASSSS